MAFRLNIKPFRGLETGVVVLNLDIWQSALYREDLFVFLVQHAEDSD